MIRLLQRLPKKLGSVGLFPSNLANPSSSRNWFSCGGGLPYNSQFVPSSPLFDRRSVKMAAFEPIGAGGKLKITVGGGRVIPS